MGTLKEYAEFEAILKEGEVNDQLFIINHRDGQRCHGKYLPGVKIPITSKSNIKQKPDYALVLAWNFIDEIKRKNSDLAHKFISIKDLEN